MFFFNFVCKFYVLELKNTLLIFNIKNNGENNF